MLKLCPAIQAIYQNELKYGNRISVVSNFTHKKDATATLVVTWSSLSASTTRKNGS